MAWISNRHRTGITLIGVFAFIALSGGCPKAPEVIIPKFAVLDEQIPEEHVVTAERYIKEFISTPLQEDTLRLKLMEQAEFHYQKALFLDPKYLYGYLSYGAALTLKTRHFFSTRKETGPRAWQQFEQAANLADNPPIIHYYLAYLHVLWKELPDAREEIIKARELGMDDPYLVALNGFIFYLEGKPPRARDELEPLKAEDAPEEISAWARKRLRQISGSFKEWEDIPPLHLPTPPRQTHDSISPKLCLTIQPFIKGEGVLEKKISKIFSTVLPKIFSERGRFTILDPSLPVDHADIALNGKITGIKREELVVEGELEVVSTKGGEQLWYENFSIRFHPYHYQLIEEHILAKLAGKIEDAFPLRECSITKVEDKIVIFPLGENHGIRKGMEAVILPISPFFSESTWKISEDPDAVLCEVLIHWVQERSSQGKVLTPGRVTIQEGDRLRLK